MFISPSFIPDGTDTSQLENASTLCLVSETTKRKLSTILSDPPIVTDPQPIKLTEKGNLSLFSAVSVVLSFESEPFWLLSSQPQFIDRIYIDNSISSFSELHSYLTPFTSRLNLYNKLISRIGLSKFCFSFTPDQLHPSTILLVSGSPALFSSATKLHPSLRAVFARDHHYPRRKLPLTGMPLRRLSRVECGGPSSFICLTGFHNCSITPSVTKIRRTIHHYLSVSTRPAAHIPSQELTYTLAHRLNIHHLSRPVVYPSPFYATGYRQRSLTPLELGLAFGLRELMAADLKTSSFPFSSIQCLYACLKPLLQVRSSALKLDKMQIPDAPLPTHTFSPQLKSYLPLSWSTVDCTAQVSAKSDDTEPVFRLWNDRITLLSPRSK